MLIQVVSWESRLNLGEPSKTLTFLAELSAKGGGAKPLSVKKKFFEGGICLEFCEKKIIFVYMEKKTYNFSHYIH